MEVIMTPQTGLMGMETRAMAITIQHRILEMEIQMGQVGRIIVYKE